MLTELSPGSIKNALMELKSYCIDIKPMGIAPVSFEVQGAAEAGLPVRLTLRGGSRLNTAPDRDAAKMVDSEKGTCADENDPPAGTQ